MTKYKTLDECKDTVAIEFGYEKFDWDKVHYINAVIILSKAAEMYAQQYKDKIKELEDRIQAFIHHTT